MGALQNRLSVNMGHPLYVGVLLDSDRPDNYQKSKADVRLPAPLKLGVTSYFGDIS